MILNLGLKHQRFKFYGRYGYGTDRQSETMSSNYVDLQLSAKSALVSVLLGRSAIEIICLVIILERCGVYIVSIHHVLLLWFCARRFLKLFKWVVH